MAPRRTANSALRRKIAVRRSKQRRNKRPRATGLGSFIVKGVNALMSIIPGAEVFKPISDFAFKSIGFTSDFSAAPTVTVTTNVYGLGAAIAIPISAIIENAPQIPKHHNGNDIQLYTNYTHGRLLQIRLSARPIGQLTNRQGTWALAFIPYTTPESGGYYTTNVSIPTLQDVLLVPGAVSGSGTRTLTIAQRMRGNSFCSLSHPLETEIGLVLVSFHDLSRNKGDPFGVEDFGAEITVSGVVSLNNPLPHVGYASVNCKVVDKIASRVVRVNNYDIINGKCEVIGGTLHVTGTPVPSRLTPSRDGGQDQPGVRSAPIGSPFSMIEMLEKAALNADE